MRAGEIGCQHLLPFAVGHIQQRRKGIDAGVVDQHVQPPALRDRLRDQPVHVCRPRDIGRQHPRDPAVRLDLRDHLLRGLGRLPIGHDHRRAGLGKAAGDARADAAAAAGDEDDFACEVEGGG